MVYLAKFDSDGVRITSVVDGIHFTTDTEKQVYLDDGYLEITEADQDLYATGNYIRGTDGTPQEIEVTLAQAQTAKLAELNTAAANAYVAGFSSSATSAALWYDSDDKTQVQITAAALLALASETKFTTMYPSGLTIRAKATSTADDNTKVKYFHTATQIVTLDTDMQTMLATVKAKLWTYQEAVYTATTVSAVESITWDN